jgi:hypothetical protein
MTKNPPPFPRRFIFHANAVAADVFLTKVNGEERTIFHQIDGESTLAPIGGVSENRVPCPKFEAPLSEVFFYSGCHTSAEGILKGGLLTGAEAITTAHASVEEIRITNREKKGSPDISFHARSLSLTIRTTNKFGEEPRFEMIEIPVFKGLSLAGRPIELYLNEEFMECTRYSDLEKKYKTDQKFYESCTFGCTNPTYKFGDDIPRSPGSMAVCSLVRGIKWGDEEVQGHMLVARGFGVIYFGEVLLNEGERWVTMVRTQLGCENSGETVHCATDPNGSTSPPTGGGRS